MRKYGIEHQTDQARLDGHITPEEPPPWEEAAEEIMVEHRAIGGPFRQEYENTPVVDPGDA